MAKLTMEEGQDFLTFPIDSLLTLRIEKIELQDKQTRDGRDFQLLNFKFYIVSIDALGDGSDPETYSVMVGQNIYGSVSARFNSSTENRLRQWVSAILNMELEVGFELDTDLLIGRKVRALTGQYTKKGNSYPSHQIDSLVPIVGGTTAAAAPAPARELAAPF